MTQFRTNPQTGKKFPVSETKRCAACGKPVGSGGGMVEGQKVCAVCFAHDRAEQEKGKFSKSFNKKGDTKKCGRCEMHYAFGQAAEHYRVHHSSKA